MCNNNTAPACMMCDVSCENHVVCTARECKYLLFTVPKGRCIFNYNAASRPKKKIVYLYTNKTNTARSVIIIL